MIILYMLKMSSNRKFKPIGLETIHGKCVPLIVSDRDMLDQFKRTNENGESRWMRSRHSLPGNGPKIRLEQCSTFVEEEHPVSIEGADSTSMLAPSVLSPSMRRELHAKTKFSPTFSPPSQIPCLPRRRSTSYPNLVIPEGKSIEDLMSCGLRDSHRSSVGSATASEKSIGSACGHRISPILSPHGEHTFVFQLPSGRSHVIDVRKAYNSTLKYLDLERSRCPHEQSSILRNGITPTSTNQLPPNATSPDVIPSNNQSAVSQLQHQQFRQQLLEQRRRSHCIPETSALDSPVSPLTSGSTQNTNAPTSVSFGFNRRVSFSLDTCYFDSVAAGDTERVHEIVKANGVDVNGFKSYLGRRALHNSVSQCNLEMTKYLVEKLNARVNQEDDNGDTPLHRACELSRVSSHKEIIAYLIEKGARLDQVNIANELPYDVARFDSSVRQFLHEEMKRRKIDPVAVRDAERRQLMAWAHEWLTTGSTQHQILDIEHGVTLAHFVAARRYADVFKVLTRCPGIDLTATDWQGKTPLQIWAERRRRSFDICGMAEACVIL